MRWDSGLGGFGSSEWASGVSCGSLALRCHSTPIYLHLFFIRLHLPPGSQGVRATESSYPRLIQRAYGVALPRNALQKPRWPPKASSRSLSNHDLNKQITCGADTANPEICLNSQGRAWPAGYFPPEFTAEVNNLSA